MGTNYYFYESVCPVCGRGPEPIHIGKSLGGWCFGLHVTDEIKSLNDWKREWAKSGRKILDEYDKPVTPEEMERIIRRSGARRRRADSWTAEEYRANYAEVGPRGLVRHVIDGRHCVGHGRGAWDLIAGEFS